MFVYHTAMYIGDNVRDPEGVKRLLSGGTAVFDTFALCVDPEGGNLLEILHTSQLFKRVHQHKRYVVVGLADGWSESRNLFLRILQDYLKAGNALDDFKGYFTKNRGR